LTLFKEIIAVYSENYTKPINALRGKNAQLLNIKAGGTYTNHWALKDLITDMFLLEKKRYLLHFYNYAVGVLESNSSY
jgi:hypothetical protein